MTHGIRFIIAATALAAACGSPEPDQVDAQEDLPQARDTTTVAEADSAGRWPESGPVSFRRERTTRLRAPGMSETLVVTAQGPAWDSLDIAVSIVEEGGDTLWHDQWPSLLYFQYDPVEGKADSTVARVVRDHVEQLLANDRFHMDGGLPPVLSRGADVDANMREAIQYHLAELDWRNAAGLSPTAPTPSDGYSQISVEQVPEMRVNAVLTELKARPSFMYYAGGEATYAIGWSDREDAFVRIHACC